MRSSLKSRLEKLERIQRPQAIPVITATVGPGPAGGPLSGYRVNGKVIRRPTGDSEEAFRDRVANNERVPDEIVLWMHEIRAGD